MSDRDELAELLGKTSRVYPAGSARDLHLYQADVILARWRLVPVGSDYTCPQCGPDPRGAEQHAWYAHTMSGIEGLPFPD